MPSGDRRPAASWQAQHTGLSIVADAMSRFVAFTDAEVSALRSLESKPDTVIRGDELVAPGQRGGKPFVILDGAVVEFRIDASGRRQALELMLRGEIANLRATILGATDIFMVAASDCAVSRFTADDFHRLVAAEVVANLAPIAVREGKEISLAGAQGPVAVNGSHKAIAITVRNVLKNAIRHAPRSSAVDVDVSELGEISITDRGDGVPVGEPPLGGPT